MRRNILIVIIMVLSLSISHQLLAQSFTLNGNGARAAGMGNAFVGVADDATAISWNAAGLTQLYSMEASLIGRFSFGSLNTGMAMALTFLLLVVVAPVETLPVGAQTL